jgi:hypothetical protein
VRNRLLYEREEPMILPFLLYQMDGKRVRMMLQEYPITLHRMENEPGFDPALFLLLQEVVEVDRLPWEWGHHRRIICNMVVNTVVNNNTVIMVVVNNTNNTCRDLLVLVVHRPFTNKVLLLLPGWWVDHHHHNSIMDLLRHILIIFRHLLFLMGVCHHRLIKTTNSGTFLD